jgi:hypothetical protein
VSEAEVDKKGDGYVLKSDPSIRVHARAHKVRVVWVCLVAPSLMPLLPVWLL